jgi:hypothetical protein
VTIVPRVDGLLGDPDLLAALGVGSGAERAQRLLDDLRSDAVAGMVARSSVTPSQPIATIRGLNVTLVFCKFD